jgi:hypothetical protein
MYDPERCCGDGPGTQVGEPIPPFPGVLPTPLEEQLHPTKYMPMFGTLAHAHGYSVIVAPALNLLTVPGADCTQREGEDLFAAYLRCGFARSAASHADAIDIQAQTYQCDTDAYAAHVKAGAGQARGSNANVRIESGLSSGRCEPNGNQLYAAHQAVAGIVDGHFMVVVEPTHQAAIDFLGRLSPTVVDNAGFAPVDHVTIQGSTVAWRVGWDAQEWHSITDRSGLALFDSGLRKPGSMYRHPFMGAGTYVATDVATGSSGTVSLPVLATPAHGGQSTRFVITAAIQDAPTGYVFATQILRPHDVWRGWRTGPSNAFVPDAGPGVYVFRSRLERKSNGAASGWSPEASIGVDR